jgi:hypothetical protein
VTRVAKTCIAALLIVAVSAAVAPFAAANTPIDVYGLLPSTTQAGGHPDLHISFSLENGTVQQEKYGINTECDCENPRFLTVHSPSGLVGNPQAVPRCTAADFASISCPVDTQIGIVEVTVTQGFARIVLTEPVYNLVPRAEDPGLVGFDAIGTKVFELLKSRTGGDYGLDTTVSVFNGFPTQIVNQVFFGVPASPEHDNQRFQYQSIGRVFLNFCDQNGNLMTPNQLEPLAAPSGPQAARFACELLEPPAGPPGSFGSQTPAKSSAPETPFTLNPTTCGVPLESTGEVLSYDGGITTASEAYPAATGCDKLDFNPSLSAKPTTTEADSPSGLDIDLTVPQPQSATAPSPSQIKATTVTLPPGFTINSNAADGKTSCKDVDANIGTGSEDPANCPEFAKVGTLEVHTALLPGPLPGYVYLGAPQPGNRYRAFLVADGFATHIKLPGSVYPDPVTGQLVISFKDLPQTPFEEFNLHIFGSERGILATPTHCGTYAVHTTFTPWDGVLPEQDSTQFFTIDSGPNGTPCPGSERPFNPDFEAGSDGNTAGEFSPLSVVLSRDDGDQLLKGLNVTTPLGFSASLKGVPYCPQSAIDQLASSTYSGIAEQTAPACPAGSQIGTLKAGAGAGSRPLNVDGKVYLAGPYKGAPLSLLVVIPAVSGPYDLGTVAVRAAIHVDPVTARVTTVSDPLPEILEGIPLRTRSLRVNVDRKDFALNPKSGLGQRDRHRRSGSHGGAIQLLPGGQLRLAALQTEAQPQALGRPQPPRAPGDPSHAHGPAGRSEPAENLGRAARR